MSFLSNLFRSQKPVVIESIGELWQTCISMGGEMYASDEYGNLFYIEKVDEMEGRKS